MGLCLHRYFHFKNPFFLLQKLVLGIFYKTMDEKTQKWFHELGPVFDKFSTNIAFKYQPCMFAEVRNVLNLLFYLVPHSVWNQVQFRCVSLCVRAGWEKVNVMKVSTKLIIQKTFNWHKTISILNLLLDTNNFICYSFLQMEN